MFNINIIFFRILNTTYHSHLPEGITDKLMCSLGIYNETRKVYSVSSSIILECVINIIVTLVWSFQGLERVPRHSAKWHSLKSDNQYNNKTQHLLSLCKVELMLTVIYACFPFAEFHIRCMYLCWVSKY